MHDILLCDVHNYIMHFGSETKRRLHRCVTALVMSMRTFAALRTYAGQFIILGPMSRILPKNFANFENAYHFLLVFSIFYCTTAVVDLLLRTFPLV